MRALVIATVAAAVLLAGCKPPQSNRSFADEDECEAAGMSDSFCDNLFPEAEDFFKKKSKPKQAPGMAPFKTKPKASYSSRLRAYRKK
jgi:uncharacterized protein YgiB involved in biofilm formation